MNLTRSLRLAIAFLLAVHLLTAFGAVALIARMRPAIERLIDENAYSLEAVETMLSVLATTEGAIEGAEAERYRAAYERAAANVTEPREKPIIDALARGLEPTLAGDGAARRASLEQLRELGTVNRDDMLRTHRKAQALGTAGAWAVVFLALLTLVGALVAIRRLDRRVLHPMEELYDVVVRTQKGDRHRRCRRGLGPAAELGEIMTTFNGLLDERDRAQFPEQDVEERFDRAVLLHFLDRTDQPSLLLSESGHVVAANAAGLDALAAVEGLRERLRDQVTGEAAASNGLSVTPLAEGRRFLVVLEGG